MYFGTVRSRSGQPLKGIRVSDGQNVVRTKADGSFVLSGWEKASLIYCCVLTMSMHDWYLPISPDSESYDFMIDPVQNEDRFQFLHLSDTEINKGTCDGYVEWIKKRVEEDDALFLIHGGDICEEEGMLRHRKEMNPDTIGCAVRYSIGNHDFCAGPYGEKRYEELYGPIWYSFDLGRIHFVVMAISKGSGFDSGYTFDEQARWLANDLSSSKCDRVVIFRHNELEELDCFVYSSDSLTLDLKSKGLISLIQGHAHTNFLLENNGVLHMCSSRPDCGGIDNTAGSMRLVAVDGTFLTSKILFNTTPFSPESHAVWLRKLDGTCEYAPIHLYDGDLIAATADDGYPKRCGLYRIDGESGAIKWFFKSGNSIKNDFALDNRAIYFEDSAGTVYAINAENGDCLWKRSLYSQPRNTRGSVALFGNTLYVGSGRKPVYLNKNSGDILFEGELVKKGDTAPSKTILSDDGKTVYYNAQWFRLLALDANSGETKWDLRTQKGIVKNHGAFWYRTNTPTLADGKLYAFGFSHGAVVDAETGEILLHKDIGLKTEVVGSSAIENGLIYLPTGKQGVVVLDQNTLEKKWSYEVGGAVVYTSSYVSGAEKTVESAPQIIGETLYFAANDGYVYVCDKKSPKILNKIKLAYPTLTAPIIKDGYLFALSFDGTLGKYPIP